MEPPPLFQEDGFEFGIRNDTARREGRLVGEQQIAREPMRLFVQFRGL